MIRLEVRCCCTPENLLGSLPWCGGPAIPVGERIAFVLRSDWHDPLDPPVEVVTLIVDLYVRQQSWVNGIGLVERFRHEYPAFCSNEIPLAQLRRIPGFVEA